MAATAGPNCLKPVVVVLREVISEELAPLKIFEVKVNVLQCRSCPECELANVSRLLITFLISFLTITSQCGGEASLMDSCMTESKHYLCIKQTVAPI